MRLHVLRTVSSLLQWCTQVGYEALLA
jgi:hypothetical protein